MKITHIYAENYKTYKRLDLDLSVNAEHPIILVGGENGCGKTTLFDAIYCALYGMNIQTPRQFEELFNAGVKVEQGMEGKCIVLEIAFNGFVLGRNTPYRLKRTWRLSEGKVQWNVELLMDGGRYSYGNASPATQRANTEALVNKIIAANLPSELSNYFLFDAMKTSDLVKEEQINKLIMQNINSVMGFSKYKQLKDAADVLLTERKAAKLENERQRQDYEKLVSEKSSKEGEQRQKQEDYDRALQFSIENKDIYELLKQGRNNDELTRAKMERQKENIDSIVKKAANYRQDMDNVMKDLEITVLYPKLAALIRTEVEMIVNEKQKLANERGEEITDEQLNQLTRDIVEVLKEKYAELADVDENEVVRKIQSRRKHGDVLSDKYPYLTDKNVEALQKLTKDAYVNPFISIDDDRDSLILDVHELPVKKNQLEALRRELSKSDYTIIAQYEDNEKRINQLKADLANLQREIENLANKIASYDYDIPQVPDPQYDMLCKLPDFFRGLSVKLLAAKRKNIEEMMKDELNKNLVVYQGVIGRVSLSEGGADEINFKIYHKDGNEIFLSQLNAGAKQTVMQVLLKVLYEMGDYDPPVMIDTVMGVLDKASRAAIIENYFPNLAEQSILLSTDTEITPERDFKSLAPFIAKTYTLHRDKEAQCTVITEDYFELKAKDYCDDCR